MIGRPYERITSGDRDFPLEQRSVTVGDRNILYQVGGSGAPVVMVHGLSGSSQWWWKNLPEIGSRYRVYLVDLPGFGSMSQDVLGFRLSEAAGWLASWIRALEIEPVHLISHSLGGFISVRLVRDHPDLVDRLILVAPAGVPEHRPLIGYTVSLLRAARQLSPEFAAILARDFLRAGPRTVVRTARDLLVEDAREDLGNIEHPTLLIWGAEDPMISSELAAVFRSEIRHSELLILERTGHVPMIDRPEEFNRAVLAFLEGKRVGS
jgi:pimeloyl-ACP methyl ester carboxylesterase